MITSCDLKQHNFRMFRSTLRSASTFLTALLLLIAVRGAAQAGGLTVPANSVLQAALTAAAQPGTPVLLSEVNSTRAIALDSLTWMREPIQITSPYAFGSDQRTRIVLFAANLDLLPGEDASAVTADAEDGSHRLYPLTVEYVGKVPGFEQLSCVIVRLNDDLGDVGDVLLRVSLHGVASNRVRIGVGHIGGGPVDNTPTPTPAPPNSPDSFVNRDIGNVNLAGSTSYSNGTFTITGAGADIWERADAFQYVYQPLNGDGQIIARVVSMQNTDGWAKAGVMIRESLAADSRHAMMVVTPGNGIMFQQRTSDSGISTSVSGSIATAPSWVKLVRRGNNVSGYYSSDGMNWILVGTLVINMASNVHVGLAVTSHNNSILNLSAFDNVSVTLGSNLAATPASTPTNNPPSVSITVPNDNATFAAPANIDITANASDSNGTIAKVEFFQGSTKLGEDTASPYSFTWSGVPAGSYLLTAQATDNQGATKTSSAISITVGGGGTWTNHNIGSIGVAGSSTYANGVHTVNGAGGDIWGRADSFHYIYQPLTGDGEIVARLTSFPATNINARAGVMLRESLARDSRHVYLSGRDNLGIIELYGRSSVGGETVINGRTGAAGPQWLKLVRRGNTVIGYNSSDGTNWSQVGDQVTVTIPSSAYIGLAVTSHDISKTEAATFERVTASTAVSNAAPTANIANPATGATFAPGSDITISATASDFNGLISKVEFFQGAVKMGEDTAAPYSYLWVNVQAGKYTLTAKATDNTGMVGASTPVSITVSGPELAKSADAFVDSMGTNTHMSYFDTAYRNIVTIKAKLSALGLRHVRDTAILTNDTAYNNMVYGSYKELVAAGIKFDLIVDSRSSGLETIDSGKIASIVTYMGGASNIASFEGPNEFDMSPSWVLPLRSYQQNLYQAVKNNSATANTPVVGPSLVRYGSRDELGDLSAHMDYGNMHSYPGGRYPSSSLDGEIALNRKVSGNTNPLLATETGYHNAVQQSMGHLPASETATGKYIPRLFLEYFNSGVNRTYSYEFIDLWPDAEKDEQEKNFGLLRNDLTEKPAYVALKNLISLMKDSGSSFTRGVFDYTLSGSINNVRHTLLQKRDGRFYLVLWLEVPSYDITTKQDIAVPKQRVTVTLNTRVSRAATYLPYASSASTGQYSAPAQLTLDVPDHPLVIELTP